MTKSLKKPLSVEKEIEYLRFAMREPCGCKACEDDRANIGDNCVIRQALTLAHQAGFDEAETQILQEIMDDLTLLHKRKEIDDNGFCTVRDLLHSKTTR